MLFNDFKSFFIILVVFILIDLFWAYLIGNKFSDMISAIQHKSFKPLYIYGLLVYIIAAFGLFYFTNSVDSLNDKLKNAFIYGFTTYAIYEFTNVTFISGWNIPLALADSLWGGILSTITIFIVYKLGLI